MAEINKGYFLAAVSVPMSSPPGKPQHSAHDPAAAQDQLLDVQHCAMWSVQAAAAVIPSVHHVVQPVDAAAAVAAAVDCLLPHSAD